MFYVLFLNSRFALIYVSISDFRNNKARIKRLSIQGCLHTIMICIATELNKIYSQNIKQWQ